jgi:hypothetical protein
MPTGPGSEEVARTIGDAEEAWLIWKWLRDARTSIDLTEGPIDPAAASVPRLERIAV